MKYLILLSLFGLQSLEAGYKIGPFLCGDVNMINKTKSVWDKNDFKVLESAKQRCPIIYSDAPCVVKFVKKGEKDYGVRCGVEIFLDK